MPLTNAQRQAAYRVRHLKDADGLGERLNMVVSVDAKNQLQRLASCYGVTQRQLIERVLADAQREVLNKLDSERANAYYDHALTLGVVAEG
jgi:hypothetical protein